MAEMSSAICTLISMGFILCGLPIFTDFAFLNYQMLVTVVFASLQVKYSWINHSQRRKPGYICFLMHCDALVQGSFLLPGHRSTLLSHVQCSPVPVHIRASLTATAIE